MGNKNIKKEKKKENKNFENNNKNIKFIKNIVNDSYTYDSYNNSFLIFNSINNILYLIYANKNISIISYNLISNQKINEIKKAHRSSITSLRYHLDNTNKRDLIISLSNWDNSIKLWNINNFELLLNIRRINQNGQLYSACFLNDNEQIYILSTNFAMYGINDPIKIYDLNGKKIKEIDGTDDGTFFICTYFDNKLSNNFILTANYGYIKSYNYSKGEIYHEYSEDNYNIHYSLVINNSDNITTKLIESSIEGIIRTWDFHTGDLLNKITLCENPINNICLWDNDYLFAACGDKTIKIVDLITNFYISSIECHKNCVNSLKKIIHPKYGKCLISQGCNEGSIKLLKFINNYFL